MNAQDAPSREHPHRKKEVAMAMNVGSSSLLSVVAATQHLGLVPDLARVSEHSTGGWRKLRDLCQLLRSIEFSLRRNIILRPFQRVRRLGPAMNVMARTVLQ